MRLDVPIVLGLLATAVGVGAATAQISNDVVRLGVLNDQSNVYADLGGPGSVIAARMAIAALAPDRYRAPDTPPAAASTMHPANPPTPSGAQAVGKPGS